MSWRLCVRHGNESWQELNFLDGKRQENSIRRRDWTQSVGKDSNGGRVLPVFLITEHTGHCYSCRMYGSRVGNQIVRSRKFKSCSGLTERWVFLGMVLCCVEVDRRRSEVNCC